MYVLKGGNAKEQPQAAQYFCKQAKVPFCQAIRSTMLEYRMPLMISELATNKARRLLQQGRYEIMKQVSCSGIVGDIRLSQNTKPGEYFYNDC